MSKEPAGRDRHSANLVAHLPLADGLGLCLSLVDERPAGFELAALRWHARFVDHARPIAITEAQATLAALASLRGARRGAAAARLRDLCLRHDQDEAARVLERWLRRRAPARLAGPPSAGADALVGLEAA